MANELSVVYETDKGKVSLSADTVRRYLVGDANVTDQEVVMFIELCRYQQLNPYLREAYLVKYGTSPASIVTGKEVFTQRAQADERFAGFEAGITIIREDGLMERRDGSMLLIGERLVGAWARVYIKGYTVPMFDEVSFTEYMGRKADGTPTKMWATKPGTMIRKVALVHALREAFPDKFKGLYTPEEINTIDADALPVNVIEVPVMEVKEAPPVAPTPPPARKYDTPAQVPVDVPAREYTPRERVSEQPNDMRPEQFYILFGKHNGKTLKEINVVDRGYIEWLARESTKVDIKANATAFLKNFPVNDTKKKTTKNANEQSLMDNIPPPDMSDFANSKFAQEIADDDTPLPFDLE
jgi:phage recombination protein Bet